MNMISGNFIIQNSGITETDETCIPAADGL